jgi:HNH endonuclease
MGKRGPAQAPRAVRFWSRVDSTSAAGCWPWTGQLHVRVPYGVFYDDDARYRRAHRIAYELANDVVLTPEQVVRHRCDNPPCCRPDHLLVGSQADNLVDMRDRCRDVPPPVERGRQRYNATLTDDMVRAARAARAQGRSVAAVARQYDVHPATLRLAARGGSWQHVD